MRVKPRPGARAEPRLHPSQRRGATEGQLHASHVGAEVPDWSPRTAGSGADLCHSDDWREANEGLDHPARSPQASEFADGHHTVPPYLPAERDQRKPAPRRSRRHPRSMASGSVGRVQSALLSATAASPAGTVTCQKTRSVFLAGFSEDSELRFQDRWIAHGIFRARE